MTIEIVLVGLASFALLVLGVMYSYRGRRLEAAEKEIREARFRAERAVVEEAVKVLEKKSNESSTKADQLLSDYGKRFNPEWRPGNGQGPDDSK